MILFICNMNTSCTLCLGPDDLKTTWKNNPNCSIYIHEKWKSVEISVQIINKTNGELTTIIIAKI